MLRSSWTPGPAGLDGQLLVSVTEFTAKHLWYMPGIYRAGRDLAQLWPNLDGAVGHWLWMEPLRRRCGAVSVWQDKKAMRSFVGLPVHRQIMRTYRTRGTVRATTWTADDPDLTDVWRQARKFLHR
ncbi:hypothetical protein JOF56_005341 [Kibdelosporangium banguiense]|uniref:DUF3291 domain-containing protein n=1 Tax=Kibdelosporangium banguiense TaxID=1365924 RepID=A0ABS4TM47_9PSEU|nr:hypothetical protein [Kibdelosporangium banguiense]MBP2324956.1 hypothetical protein [Kibdelosporangium banguiense]